MDAITVRLPCEPESGETFTLMTADYDPHSSATGAGTCFGSIANMVMIRLSVRYPRLYKTGGKCIVVPGISMESY